MGKCFILSLKYSILYLYEAKSALRSNSKINKLLGSYFIQSAKYKPYPITLLEKSSLKCFKFCGS